MNKAEDRAMKKYPFTSIKDYANNEKKRYYFIEGYHQAEKDFELSWKDVKKICVQSVLVEIDLGGLVSDERHYTEVLKRFNKERKEK